MANTTALMDTFINKEQLQQMEDTAQCFSEDNFNTVYKYIQSKIKDVATYYSYEGYEIYLSSGTDIKFKQKGQTLAVANKENGIYSLFKILKDNQRQVEITHELFCQLLNEAIG